MNTLSSVRTLLPLLVLLVIGADVALAQRLPDAARELERRREEYEESRRESMEEENPENVRGRQEWFDFQRRFPYDQVPAGARAAAIEQARTLEARLIEGEKGGRGIGRTLSERGWTEIGPFNVGGRIRAIAHHPTQSGVVYVGAASGGVWKTTNSGASWASMFSGQTSLAIGALAIDYLDPDVIYAGTGEDSEHSADYFSDGIFKSTDAGATWKNAGLRSSRGFSRIITHRQKSGVVYAAAVGSDGGFFRTSDGGGTWERTFGFSCYDIAVDPVDNDIVTATFLMAIHRSTDGGRTWKELVSGLPRVGGPRIALAASASDRNRIYALYAIGQGRDTGGPGGQRGAIYRTDDGGAQWRLVQSFDPSFFNGQGFYDICLAVHPTDPDIVLAGGIDIYRSSDGGNSFENITRVYEQWGTDDMAHADQHVLEFDPHRTDRVLLGSDGGVYASDNTGLEWRRISRSLPITQFYRMDVDPTDVDRVYGGTQDNGTVGVVTGDPSDWMEISGGDGFFVAVDPTNPRTVYSEVYYGQAIFRINTLTWDTEYLGWDIPEEGDWSTPLAVSPVDGAVYSGRRDLWRSGDEGNSWEALDPGTGAYISAIGLSPHDAGHMAIGVNYGAGVRVSSDKGETWTISTGIPGRTVTDIRFDPVVPTTLYATVSGFHTGHVFRSDDLGRTFRDISASLPDAPINTIAIDPENHDHLFVGSDVGVFASLDGGGLWLPFNEDLPPAPIVDLKIHKGTRTLIAATHGRSMFSINISTVDPQPLIVAPMRGETIQTPGEMVIRWVGTEGPVRVTISVDGGLSYTVVAERVEGNSVTTRLATVRHPSVRLRVQELEGKERLVESRYFALVPRISGSDFGMRGFAAEAIEVRGRELWASARDNDSIYRLRLPLLSGRNVVARTNITGRTRDMAYDAESDRFYVLVDDAGRSRLFIMDTGAVGRGEIPLPAGSFAGVAVTPEGLTLATASTAPELWTIDTAGRVLGHTAPLVSGAEGSRTGLVWNGNALAQGVMNSDTAVAYPSMLQLVERGDPPRLLFSSPVVLTGSVRVVFSGLAYSAADSARGALYFATDTAGRLYRFFPDALFPVSAVPEIPLPTSRPGSGVTIASVSPNPISDRGEAEIILGTTSAVTLELHSSTGETVASGFSGTLAAGRHRLPLPTGRLASGIYYLVVETGAGRAVRSVVVMR